MVLYLLRGRKLSRDLPEIIFQTNITLTIIRKWVYRNIRNIEGLSLLLLLCVCTSRIEDSR